MDADAAHAVLDGLLAAFTLETVLSGVLLPYLRELGELAGERGEASVAQEHFASNVLRARLLALARGWERGGDPTALLACAPGEQHDLPLIAFGLALRGRGWRIVFLGTDTPAASIAETAGRLRPALVVVSAVTPRGFRREADALAALAVSTGWSSQAPARARGSRSRSAPRCFRVARWPPPPPYRKPRSVPPSHAQALC